MPQQRKLPVEVKEKATTLLRMKANKKLIQENISKETDKVVLLKDTCNVLLKLVILFACLQYWFVHNQIYVQEQLVITEIVGEILKEKSNNN